MTLPALIAGRLAAAAEAAAAAAASALDVTFSVRITKNNVLRDKNGHDE